MSTSSSLYMSMNMSVNNSIGGSRGAGASSPASSRRSQRSALSMENEAYRRLGHRLSQRVSDGYTHRPVQATTRLGSHPRSAFSRDVSTSTTASGCEEQLPQHQQAGTEGQTHPVQLVQSQSYDRTAKVQKVRYTDHGSHKKPEISLLKKLTVHTRDTFRRLEIAQKLMESPEKMKGTKKRLSPADSNTVSPHRQALENLVIDADQQHLQLPQQPQQKGLLSSVLEDSTAPSASATTKNASPPKPKCLTQLKEPLSNDGYDNAEGNLIVMEGDLIHSNNVHGLHDSKSTTSTTKSFHILGLLGQGTFAQVFCCENLETKQRVALKVIKNKPAYTRQAAVEIDVFRALSESKKHMVQLECYFMFRNHLCLVFELLGLNLYELLKRRQFRGIPIRTVRAILRQALEGIKDLSQKSIVHCDLKPENILLSGNEEAALRAGETKLSNSKQQKAKQPHSTEGTGSTPTTEDTGSSTQGSSKQSSKSSASSNVDDNVQIKLIDFGSACFEGNTVHTYIQSRFYRSPEVLIGLPYDSAIDMWSLGCVAAELYLGLPILPGVHEHDQLGRISEMIGPLPDWMLDQGSKSAKYYVKQFQRSPESAKGTTPQSRTPSPSGGGTGSPAPPRPTWRIKTQQEYIQSLSANEIRKKGGQAKLEKQPTNRYFKRRVLADIVMLHGHSNENKEELGLFVHFLLGILDPDPWKRWTALQASQHPFITGNSSHRRRSEEKTDREFDIYWVPPWDPSICRRKLLNVQKTREKQQAMRRNFGRTNDDSSTEKFRRDLAPPVIGGSGSTSTSRVTAMTDAMSLSRQSHTHSDRTSPPSSLGVSTSHSTGQSSSQPAPQNLTGSLGSVLHQADASEPSLQQQSFLPVSSSSYDYSHPSVGDQRLASSMLVPSSAHGISYGDVPRNVQLVTGVAGMSYEGVHVPLDADFGYALQRPGVVPGTGNELTGSYSSLNQQLPAVGFSPHQLPPRPVGGSVPQARNAALLRAAASGGTSVSGIAAARRRHVGVAHHSPRQFVSTSAIREDSTENQLEPRAGGGTSLLAQQLEEVGASNQVSSGIGLHEMLLSENGMGAMDSLMIPHQQHHQQLMQAAYLQQQQQQQQTVYGVAPQPTMGGFFTYVSANGTPVMSTVPPVATAMAPASVNHLTGSYDQAPLAMGGLGSYAAPMSLHHGMAQAAAYPVTYSLGGPTEIDPSRHQVHVQHPTGQQSRVKNVPPSYRGVSM